jgi:hypothetical protein
MMDLGATDPMDLQVHACAQLGLSRQLKQTCCVMPHPSQGGRGYKVRFCQEQLAKAATGKDVDISMSSLCHWRVLLHPYHPTGNKAKEQVVEVDLINLVTFI